MDGNPSQSDQPLRTPSSLLLSNLQAKSPRILSSRVTSCHTSQATSEPSHPSLRSSPILTISAHPDNPILVKSPLPGVQPWSSRLIPTTPKPDLSFQVAPTQTIPDYPGRAISTPLLPTNHIASTLFVSTLQAESCQITSNRIRRAKSRHIPPDRITSDLRTSPLQPKSSPVQSTLTFRPRSIPIRSNQTSQTISIRSESTNPARPVPSEPDNPSQFRPTQVYIPILTSPDHLPSPGLPKPFPTRGEEKCSASLVGSHITSRGTTRATIRLGW